MKSNDQNNTFLGGILSQLVPDVFFHPVWIHFVRNSSNHTPDLLRSLLHNLQLVQIRDDPVSSCQVIILCAYLHSQLGESSVALSSIEQAWKLAEIHDIRNVAHCSAWGACAICVRHGNYLEGAEWIGKLQEKLKEKHDWVLIDVLELFKQSLETQLTYSSNTELLDWLFRWGEWTFPETRYLSKDRRPAQPVDFFTSGIITRLLRHWNSFLALIRFRGRSRRPLQLPLHSGELINPNDSQGAATASEFEVPKTPEKISPSGYTSFSKNQIPFQSADVSASLRRSDTIPFALPQTSTSRQSGLPSLAVYCLGQFQAYQNEQLIENWLSRKALSVFKYLVLQHPTPVVKEKLMDIFWTDSDAEAARRNLHQAIYALRQILRGEQREFHHIFFKNDCYSLNPNMEVWIDFREFEKCLRAGRHLDQNGKLEKAIEQYGTAEGLYQGDFLEEDLYEDWPTLQREQLRNSYCSLVDRLTELYLQTSQYTSVIHLCHKVLTKDRCYESLHRMLMQCYLAQGQRHLAVRQYQACTRALREDLGMQPSRETIDLYHRITSKLGA